MTAELVVNPETGELLERLDQQPPETLADALQALRDRVDEYKRMAAELDAELRRRLVIKGRKTAVFGGWEVEAKIPRERDWDSIELEGAIGRLVDDGIVQAGEVADVITRPPVVSKSKAWALRGRLDGDARAQVDAAWTWKERAGQLILTRSVDLIGPPDGDGAPDAVAATPPAPQLSIKELFADD